MIGPVIAATLPLMRAHAESLMTDTCDVERASGSTWDEALQKSVTTWAAVHEGVSCSLEQPAVTAQSLLTDEIVTQESPTVHMPVTVTGIEPDDRITFTAVGPMSDPALVGAVMWVTHVLAHTHPVERLVECRWTR